MLWCRPTCGAVIYSVSKGKICASSSLTARYGTPYGSYNYTVKTNLDLHDSCCSVPVLMYICQVNKQCT